MISDLLVFTDAERLFKGQKLKWDRPPCIGTIGKEGVHLWRMELDTDDHTLRRYLAFLSEDERDRAGRFRFETDRRRFIARKGAQRVILARYFGMEPRGLQFRYTAEGKPFLESSSRLPPIQFSASSSDALGLLAVAYDRRIGVDLEQKGRTIEYEEIAASFFAPSEVNLIDSLPEAKKADAFWACWTAKEAYLKAAGRGLSFSSLLEVSVPLRDGPTPSVFRPEGPAAAEDIHTGVRFTPAERCIATLIAEGKRDDPW